MKADHTRDTFDARKHFRQVLAQQGRVQLDAELNEQGALGARRDETTTADIAGHCGGPADAAAFGMSAVAGEPGNFLLSAGRYYVDGVQCELETAVRYLQQPDLPGLTALPGGSSYLVYLDVWQRHLTFLDDRQMLETALGGVDTTTRVKNIWQVRTMQMTGPLDCGIPYLQFSARTQDSTIRLQARAQTVASAGDPCQMAEASGYTSLENQLYRVEIHSLEAADQARGNGRAAVWKWSRENGSVEVELKAVDVAGKKLTVSSLGRDEKLGIRKGHFVEITDDSRELAGLHGDLIEVDDVDEGDLTITLKAAPAIITAPTPAPALHPRVRRWEGMANIQTNPWLALEAGIQVKFTGVDLARPGDYWQIPARTSAPGTQAGTIEWPQTVPGTADALLPRGIQHHYCRLGFVTVSTGVPVFADCRCLWPSLTGVPRLFYLSGDGQEVMPRTALNKLPQPLIAGIANAHCAEGARIVRFTVTAGNGRVALAGGATTATTVNIPINAAGEARCDFHLDATNYSQQVRAELLDAASQPVRPAIFYNASLSVAREVAYDSECKGMDGANTVQKAITRLAGAVHLSAVGGDGQDGALDKVLPLPLRVAVTSACGPVDKQTVIFRSSRVDDKSPLGKLASGQFSKNLGGGSFVDVLEVTTGADGFAECLWKLPAHHGFDVFEAIAELKDANKLTLEGPAAVRFTANLRTSGADEDPGAVHVIRTRIFRKSNTAQEVLANGDSIFQPALLIEAGIAVDLDGPLTASTVATFHETGAVSAPGVPSNPSCFLICELPWPLFASEHADVKSLFPNASPAVLGFRPFIVRCETTFLKAGSQQVGPQGPDLVRIKPEAASVQFLYALFTLMGSAKIPQRLLMRLTLKGNFIWRETTTQQLKDKGPAGWLDGDAWMVSRDQHPSALQSLIDPKLASGDRRRGGDFEMWFWLAPPPITPPR